ncbi:MAG: helix-hairpin-helix domain-containing protein [Geminicoccaceae bacterium]
MSIAHKLGDHSNNAVIAANLRELADILEQQQADGFRMMAYRRAAETVASLDRPLEQIVEEKDIGGLTELPNIGRSIASAILEMLRTGRWSQLERLRGSLQPEQLFQTIPGIGSELAERIHDGLHVDTLEALELAAHDGRLERVSGLGPRRVAIIRTTLGERLGRRRLRRSQTSPVPPVDLILGVDVEYRDKAAKGRLRTIAPKRFNPSGEAWLSVLHTKRQNWDFTALFSNTRLAHELGRTDDWVVVFFHTDQEPEGQCTVVSETRGELIGQRVVRGRETECREFYAA